VHNLPPLPPGVSEAEFRYRIAELEWQDDWLPAAKKYLFKKPKRGSVPDLARCLKATLDLARDKRSLAQLSYAEKILRDMRLQARKELDEMWKQATETRKGRNFFHRLWKAADYRQPLDANGAVVLAADRLWKKQRRKPTRQEVERRVKQWLREGYRKNPAAAYRTPERWNQIFRDPLIRPLIQDD
jgi:hypothetical protein